MDFPSSPPTAQDWLNYRHVIEDLYMRSDVKLADVAEIMSTRYRFFASKNMYKKRLMAWDLRKNYRREEKQALLDILRADGEGALQNSRIHGRKIAVHRVKRYDRQGRMLGAPSSSNPLDEPQALVLNNDNINNINEPSGADTVPPRHLRRKECAIVPRQDIASSLPPFGVEIEQILHLAQSACEPCLLNVVRNCRSRYHRPRVYLPETLQKRSTVLSMALFYLHQGNVSRGFQLLHAACDQASSRAGEPYHGLLCFARSIMDLICVPAWDHFEDIREHLVLFFARLLPPSNSGESLLRRLRAVLSSTTLLSWCRSTLLRRLQDGWAQENVRKDMIVVLKLRQGSHVSSHSFTMLHQFTLAWSLYQQISYFRVSKNGKRYWCRDPEYQSIPMTANSRC